MFKRVVSILKQLMGCQPTAQSLPTVATPSKPAKRSPVQSGQVSPKAVQEQTPRPRKSSPVRTPRKQKTEVAQPTTAAAKRGRKKSTAPTVATASQSKPTGSKSATPARKTRQHAK